MPNLFMNHEPVAMAALEMNAVAQRMKNEFDTLMTGLNSLIGGGQFDGQIATAFGTLYNSRAFTSTVLGESFGTGAGALDEMHQTIRDGDARGAAQIGNR